MIELEMPKEPVLRGYLLSFVNSADPVAILPRIAGDRLVLDRTGGGNVTELLAEVYRSAGQKVENVLRRLPLSNNDKAIIVKPRGRDKPTVYGVLGLSPEDGAEKMFQRVADLVEEMSDHDFADKYRGERIFAPPSLLRIEHYQAGRAPFFVSKKLDRTKPENLSLLQITTLLAGYALSHAGYVTVEEGHRSALLLLPQAVGKMRKRFSEMVLGYRERLPPGARPEEALYLWFALTLPEDLIEVSALGITEPFGMNPSKVDFSLHMNIELQRRIWDEIGFTPREDEKKLWLSLLSAALRPGRRQVGVKSYAVEYSKLLFRASQCSTEALRELLWRSSRTVAALQRAGAPDDRLIVAKRASIVAERMLQRRAAGRISRCS